MGLDMYLSKRTYVKQWAHTPAEERFEVTVTRGGQPYPAIRPERVSYVEEQVAYWRKANAIHAWFVDHVQDGDDDCKDYYVPVEKLKELVELCRDVLAGNKSGEEELPTRSGFFFGGTDYGTDYTDDLRLTIEQLEPLLSESGDGDFSYHSSW